ncbi:MAG: sigma-54-dependent Fis family transcriptional regulator [Bacteroidetes bacterium]|nr:sigma-54-dependent Fis family transcriptional regulator [Bacteroidota bacterium]
MPKLAGNILIVDDDEDVLTSAQMYLEMFFETVKTLNSPTNIIAFLQANDVHLVLLDMNYQKGDSDGGSGLLWLRRIRDFNPDIIVIPMTAFAEVSLAVEAVKKGAFDFITKPWQNEKLLATISAGFQLRNSRQEIAKLKSEQQSLKQELAGSFNEFIGESEPIQKIKSTIAQVAKTDANVLLIGENGVGKEVAARSLHLASNRKDEAFISVDMGAIPAPLFESELFGVEKGAYTDAKESRAGKLVAANKGTLFLDEIGNIDISLQPKLLGALQNRMVTPLGSTTATKIDVRLVSATNQNLEAAINDGTFRQDLLYRLKTVEIVIPPLRERPADIELLAQHFISFFNKRYLKDCRLTPAAIRSLKNHQWPGNIRELKHAIERAIILSNTKNLQDFAFSTPSISGKSNNSLNLLSMEKNYILKALEKHKGNVSQAAKELGLTRAALYRRMEKHGI